MSTKLKAGTATSGAVIDADTTGILELQSGSTPTTAITVDASQNVGIGMTPVANYGALQVGSAVTSALGVSGLKTYVSSTNSALGQNGNMSVITTDAQGSDIGGSIGLGGKFVSTGLSVLFAQISGRKENSTDNNSAGYLQFATQPNGGTPTERMRIDSSGNFLVNTTGSSSPSNSSFIFSPSQNAMFAGGGIRTHDGQTGTNWSNVFNIYWTGSAQLWIDSTNIGNITVVSDYRIKRNIETQTLPALERVMALRPVTYQMANYGKLFKSSEDIKEGFIAHEVQEVIPSGVDGEKDAENQIQSLRVDAILAVAVKAIQEQQALITDLTTRLSALEAK